MAIFIKIIVINDQKRNWAPFPPATICEIFKGSLPGIYRYDDFAMALSAISIRTTHFIN